MAKKVLEKNDTQSTKKAKKAIQKTAYKKQNDKTLVKYKTPTKASPKP